LTGPRPQGRHRAGPPRRHPASPPASAGDVDLPRPIAVVARLGAPEALRPVVNGKSLSMILTIQMFMLLVVSDFSKDSSLPCP